MKTKLVYGLVVVLAAIVGIQWNLLHEEVAMAEHDFGIDSIFSEGIEDTGVVVRVRFRVLVRHYDQTREWFYFGVTEAEKPPEVEAPVTEYTYIQFPQAFDYLPKGSGLYDQAIYQIAVDAGLYREGHYSEP